MDTKETTKRRQLVVDPKFQYGLIIRVVGLITIILILSLILLTIIYNNYISNVLPISLGAGGIASSEVAQLVHLSDFIGPIMLVVFLSVTMSGIAVQLLGVRFTHRVAGPVYRLRSCIAEMTAGDLTKEVRFREKDYFQLLASDVDRLRVQWHNSLIELKTINRQLHEISNEEQRELLSRSETLLSDLLKKVS